MKAAVRPPLDRRDALAPFPFSVHATALRLPQGETRDEFEPCHQDRAGRGRLFPWRVCRAGARRRRRARLDGDRRDRRRLLLSAVPDPFGVAAKPPVTAVACSSGGKRTTSEWVERRLPVHGPAMACLVRMLIRASIWATASSGLRTAVSNTRRSSVQGA